MTTLDRLSDLPRGHRRGPTATKRLKDAYQALFTGHGGASDARLVLTDLARVSGFFMVSQAGTSSTELHENEGSRRVYARIHGILQMTPAERGWLEQAVRAENFASIEEQKEII